MKIFILDDVISSNKRYSLENIRLSIDDLYSSYLFYYKQFNKNVKQAKGNLICNLFNQTQETMILLINRHSLNKPYDKYFAKLQEIIQLINMHIQFMYKTKMLSSKQSSVLLNKLLELKLSLLKHEDQSKCNA